MDKTTVTNDPVSESGSKTIVNNGSVPGSDRDKEIENRVRTNLKAEYDREATVLKEKLSTYEDKIAELEDQPKLTSEDRDLLERLRGKKDNLDLEMQELETNPKYRAYNEKIRRDSNKAKEQAVAEAQWNMSINMGLDFVADEAEREGVDPEVLRKELNSIVNRHGLHKDKDGNVIMPHRQAKLAQKERLKSLADLKERDEFKKKQAELNGGFEAGQTNPRETSMDDLRKKGDTIGMAKKLGL